MDISILPQGGEKKVLETIEPGYCCFTEGGGFKNQGFLLKHISGFARLTLWSEEHGVEEIKEGHFKNGVQIDFGRSHSAFKTIASDNYAESQHFTGWFPSYLKVGEGIAITDSEIVNEGQWFWNPGFPNNGADFVNPQRFTSYKVTDMNLRYY